MINQSSKQTKMSMLSSEERICTFKEVMQGYTEEEAIEEASRCLSCKKPLCVEKCPVHNDIPRFIACIKEKKFDEAYRILSEKTSLPSICGRVCPHELQCEGNCIRNKTGESVGIGKLERFVGDFHRQKQVHFVQSEKKKYSVGIVGSGPAGLACAYDLLKNHYNVHLYDAFSQGGGVLRYGIPEFVLPKATVDEQIRYLEELGCIFHFNTKIGSDLSLESLRSRHDALFLANGATIGKKMGIDGEQLIGVYDANDFLRRINCNQEHLDESSYLFTAKKVVVVGGGNVAMDAARVARRIHHCEVTIVYRRTKKEMPARKEEIIRCEEEGIHFAFLTNPVKIIGTDHVCQIECVRMELKGMDATSRPAPQVIENSNFTIDADVICMAISSTVDDQCFSSLQVSPYHTLLVDENNMTSMDGIYAGGDNVRGPATVILAMKDGKNAARAIIERFERKMEHEN